MNVTNEVKNLLLQAALCSDGNPGRASKLRRQAARLMESVQ